MIEKSEEDSDSLKCLVTDSKVLGYLNMFVSNKSKTISVLTTIRTESFRSNIKRAIHTGSKFKSVFGLCSCFTRGNCIA